MIPRTVFLFSVILSGGLSACRPGSAAESPEVEARAAEVKKRIAEASADSAGETPVAKWLLPAQLREVSGLARLPDGRLLAHNDERSRVFVIDPMTGVITKKFTVGSKTMTADFEAIAVSGADIYLLVSNGDVYQFREGDEDEVVPFTKHDTGLGKECEFESLEVEPRTGAFILACKNISKKSERNQIRIYRWLRRAGGAAAVSMINVPLAEAIGTNDWKQLSPSDIAIDPRTGNYVLVAGPEKALIEITAQGELVGARPIPGDPQQTEGVVITPDGLLILADEAVSRDADITIYPWRGLGSSTAPPVPADTTTTASPPDSSN
jgi:uncharacterized protein YjiK